MRAQGHPHRIQSFQLQVHYYRKRGSGLIWIVFVLFSLGAFSLVSHNFVAEGTTLHNGGEGLFLQLSSSRFIKDGAGKRHYQLSGLVELHPKSNQIQRHIERISYFPFLPLRFQRFIVFDGKPLPIGATFFKSSADLRDYPLDGQRERRGIEYLESDFYGQLRAELTRGIEESAIMLRPNKFYN